MYDEDTSPVYVTPTKLDLSFYFPSLYSFKQYEAPCKLAKAVAEYFRKCLENSSKSDVSLVFVLYPEDMRNFISLSVRGVNFDELREGLRKYIYERLLGYKVYNNNNAFSLRDLLNHYFMSRKEEILYIEWNRKVKANVCISPSFFLSVLWQAINGREEMYTHYLGEAEVRVEGETSFYRFPVLFVED